MERKTQVHAEEGRADLLITREFDLPLDLLFEAYTDPEIVAQWMGTKVAQLDKHKQGGFRFETSNTGGQVVFSAHGCIHELVPQQRIVRTFEMENAGFDVQLEFLDFEALGQERSRLSMQVIYRSVALRDRQLSMPFAYGINMAHDRLQEIVRLLIK